MSHTHKLDKAKVEALLLKRGWKRGLNDEWILPLGMTQAEYIRDWEECLLEGVICPAEQQKRYTEAFLKKFPTQRR